MAQNIVKSRMCVGCRQRAQQHSMIRLQHVEGSLKKFGGSGRSFYICTSCIELKTIKRTLARQCRSNAVDKLLTELKEIVSNVRKS
ncbi:MAG: DUF448 domain-containing protein [Helicobacteraceae bacterium]|nr:DUF448 domain-containing protein [Helicobacteraceae bacterium]